MFMGQVDTFRAQLENAQRVNNTLLINSFMTGSLILAMLLCTVIVIAGAGVKILATPAAPVAPERAEVFA
jgi:hypothetical protein